MTGFRWMVALAQSPDGVLMSNGEYCCAVGLCCPPASASRRTALINELSHGATGLDQATLEHVADWLITNVDMAPKGTLDLSHIADIVKKHGG